MITEKELLQMKKEIDIAKTEIAELKGQERSLLKQLNEDWGCADLQEAKAKLKKLQEESEQLSKKIEEQSELLTSKYVK